MTHLSQADLLKWRDAPSEADRARIVAHLGGCGTCADRYAELVRTRPLDAGPLPSPVEDFVARGRAIRPRRRDAAVNEGLWIRRLLPLAAAAVVLVAIIVPFVSRDDTEPVLRGGDAGVALVRPVGTTVAVADLSFEWTIEPGADRVRLHVFDLNAPGQPLLRREVTGTRYDPSADERAQLPTGRALHWFIDYRNTRSVTVTSPSAQFSLK